MRTSDGLRPCPFCGGLPDYQVFNAFTLPGRLICACGAEMRQGRHQTTAELFEAWNRRKGPAGEEMVSDADNSR